jgi:hypothetical protein
MLYSFVRWNRKVVDMRELLLLETVLLCAGLLLCLVMPTMLSVCAPQNEETRRSCMKIVWTGQVMLAVAGLAVLFFHEAARYAIVIGSLSYLGCAFVLRRKLHAAR